MPVATHAAPDAQRSEKSGNQINRTQQSCKTVPRPPCGASWSTWSSYKRNGLRRPGAGRPWGTQRRTRGVDLEREWHKTDDVKCAAPVDRTANARTIGDVSDK